MHCSFYRHYATPPFEHYDPTSSTKRRKYLSIWLLAMRVVAFGDAQREGKEGVARAVATGLRASHEKGQLGVGEAMRKDLSSMTLEK